MSGNPVCRVEWPHDGAPALWVGTYGTAKVVAGTTKVVAADKAVAVTSDGVRHAL